jgi:aspartate/glutamate racemase
MSCGKRAAGNADDWLDRWNELGKYRCLLSPSAPTATTVESFTTSSSTSLCQGVVSDRSRNLHLDVIARGKSRGADRVILGCTEICLLVGPQHIDVPVFDSTLLHADAAVEFSMTRQAPRPRAAQGVPS